MRIISGEKRGAKLSSLPGEDTRPTTDRIKESLFNIIQWDIRDARVLDLFAGSGGLGLEALSRGAQSACFADSNPSAVSVIKSNVQKLDYCTKSDILCADFEKVLNSGGVYDLIFLDPPYATDYIQRALCKIEHGGMLSPKGLIVCETLRDKQIDTLGFNIRKEVCYGITKLVFLEVRGDE